jgi:hypothetical protein
LSHQAIPRARISDPVSIKPAEMIEGEPIEMELPSGRPGILRIHQIADMAVAQGQGAEFTVLSFPNGVGYRALMGYPRLAGSSCRLAG